MEFCPKCGAMLVQKKKNQGCPRCNYSSKSKLKLKVSETILEQHKNQDVAVVKKVTDVLPVVNSKCQKCGHDEAHFWTVQTRAADEAETKFFKCLKCGHTNREYR